jgi:hypothetical protein
MRCRTGSLSRSLCRTYKVVMLSHSNLYTHPHIWALMGLEEFVMGQANRIPLPLRSLCNIGKDSEGNWVVQGPHGRYCGFFVNRAEALRFAMFENGNPHAVVMVPGTLELNMTQRT